LQDVEWTEFRIIDLFERFENGKCSNEKKQTIPSNNGVSYLSATNLNNGVSSIVEKNQLIQKGNCIMFINRGDGSAGLSVYKAENFISTTSNSFGYATWINRYTGMFVATVLNKFKKKYSFGYGRTEKRLKRDKISLPIDSSGDPNWKFMEDYVKTREEKKRLMVVKYCKEQLNRILAQSNGAKIDFNNVKWKAFKIEDVFEKIERGKRLTKKNQSEGNVPYISSSAFNNGVDNFVRNKENVRRYKDALTVANSGSVASSFYHCYEYVASDHVTNLQIPNGSRESYLFISVVIQKLKEKYSFNREMTDDRLKREAILLPATMQGTPDFRFMECFILQEEAKLYKKIIERFEN